MTNDIEYADYESIYDLRLNINYYGADFPIDSLVRRLEENTIQVPEFQRQYVWKQEEASRFIESILLGLPVPNIFLAKDKFSQKLLIVDGLQRLETLLYFVRGHYPSGNRFILKGVAGPFNQLSYRDLPNEDRYNFENYTIHATIISESDNSNRMFHLFERLNTSGTPLTSQEIRSAIYHGPFNLLLKDLTNHPTWRSLYGKRNIRMEDEELILRFFAVYYDIDHFRHSMKEFLNHFMMKHRMLDRISHIEMTELFQSTMIYVLNAIGPEAFKLGRTFNISVFDVLSYAGAKALNRIPSEVFQAAYRAAIEDEEFIRFTRSATTSRSNLLGRIEYFIGRLEM